MPRRMHRELRAHAYALACIMSHVTRVLHQELHAHACSGMYHEPREKRHRETARLDRAVSTHLGERVGTCAQSAQVSFQHTK